MKTLFLLCAIFFGQNVFSYDGCNERDPKVFFANGMFNSEYAANKSAKKLEKFIPPENVSALPVARAYNISEPVLEQLLQVLDQKSSELSAHFWKYLGNFSLAPEVFRKIAIEKISDLILQDLDDADLQKQIRNYKKILSWGHSIVIVAHSQGNFYALQAMGKEGLGDYDPRSFSIIAVASPSIETYLDGPYTNLDQDLVIKAVRTASLGMTLPPNARNSTATASGHMFAEDYLNGDRSGKKIRDDLLHALKKDQTSNGSDIYSSLAFHSSLTPFWIYFFQVLMKSENKFTKAQCVAFNAFVTKSLWQEDPCENRSVQGLQKSIEKCREAWLDRGGGTWDFCGMIGNGDLLLDDSSPEHDFIVEKHPECIVDKSRPGKGFITDGDINEAKKLVENPPVPPAPALEE